MKTLDKIVITISLLLFSIIPLLGYWECPWKKNFGIDCAGCGITRMVISIFKLNFYQAFRYNPLAFILLIIATIYFIYVVICKILKKEYYIPSYKWLFVLIVVVILFMIIRNIDAFSYLKPTQL